MNKVINPYPALGTKHKESLDYIIANLPVNPTFDDLNAKLTDSFFIPDPNEPSPIDAAEGIIKTMLPHAYNGYVNGGAGYKLQTASGKEQDASGYWRYNEAQMRVIEQMLNGLNNIPVESIGEFLSDIEENIASGKFTYEEQVPLLVATAIGKSDHEYWMAQIAAPAVWAIYLNTDSAINYAHVAGIVSASMQGALLTYGLIKPPQIQFVDIYSSTISSAGMAAGKVIFGWIGRG